MANEIEENTVYSIATENDEEKYLLLDVKSHNNLHYYSTPELESNLKINRNHGLSISQDSHIDAAQIIFNKPIHSTNPLHVNSDFSCNVNSKKVYENQCNIDPPIKKNDSNPTTPVHLFVLYGLINTILCIPVLYGYTPVIFNHTAFQPHMNALSKLVIFSSIVHQISFTSLSSLPFSIGQVQDAGLIFLSQMSYTMAEQLVAENVTDEELISTVLVILGLATASLGVVLVLMGKFRMADLVSYLPLPVVGGYLAFIGYFCVEAGVSLCIHKNIIHFSDWLSLFHQPNLVLLAVPGFIGGILIMMASRFNTAPTETATTSNSNDNNVAAAILPSVMVLLPISFYVVILLLPNYSMDDAREQGWLGKKNATVPMSQVFAMIHLDKVHWYVAKNCVHTWLGMVFVVSFSSCLDVAAISMDLGKALDVNNELITVGASNVLSGIFCGFTGSYIFSQTIFNFRSGILSRGIGIFLTIAELAVIALDINILENTPLFFLGATLIFIGLDLLFEWMIEVRHKLLLSEYSILLATFASIHFIGINGGIFFGIFIAALDYIVVTAKVSSLNKVSKRSRAVWNQEEWQILEYHGYDENNPKIITLEVIGNVFFGSSMKLLTNITDHLHIIPTEDDRNEIADSMMRSPKTHRLVRNSILNSGVLPTKQRPSTPEFLVLDLKQMQNLDTSSVRGCFYQLTKICSKNKVFICASGASPRIDWLLRSHGVAYDDDVEELDWKKKMQNNSSISIAFGESPKVILFETLDEALEFCESCIILRMGTGGNLRAPFHRSLSSSALLLDTENSLELSRYSLSNVFANYLGLKESETLLLEGYENSIESFHDELLLQNGDKIFSSGETSDAFYIVLAGAVVIHKKNDIVQNSKPHSVKINQNATRSTSDEHSIITGAGLMTHSMRKHGIAKNNASELGENKIYLRLGSIFGFVDFILGKNRTFGAIAINRDTLVAKVHRTGLERVKVESPELERLVDKLLLQVSIRELATNVSKI